MTLLMLTPRVRHGSVQRPIVQAFAQCLFRDAELSRPITHAHRDAVEGDPASDRSVLLLHFCRRPAHVAGFVMAVIVDSVQRMSRRARAHVSQELFKAQPLLADLNSASTIMLEHRVIRIATAMQHALPAFVFAAATIGGMAVSSVHLTNYPTAVAR